MATRARATTKACPLNAEGRARRRTTWDPPRQCGRARVQSVWRRRPPARARPLAHPGRDDDTLRVEFDAGNQTRLLEFGAAAQASGERTWQGFSRAEWQRPPGGNAGPCAHKSATAPVPSRPAAVAAATRRAAAVELDHARRGAQSGHDEFREGYLRKNGVPYSENAAITEYFHRLPEHANGDVWLHVVTIVEDPRYLTTRSTRARISSAKEMARVSNRPTAVPRRRRRRRALLRTPHDGLLPVDCRAQSA